VLFVMFETPNACMRICFLLFLFISTGLFAQSNYEQAEAYFRAEQFVKAKPIFLQYLSKNRNDAKTREYLGEIAGYTEKYDQAIEIFKELVTEFPMNADYQFKLGGTLGMKALSISKIRALSYINDIKFHLQEAARLDVRHIETRWALVEFYMQLPGIIGGSEAKATSYAKQLGTISEVDGCLAQGYIAEYSERPSDAERFYKQAIKIGGSVHTYEKLTTHYEKNNQPEAAIATASQSLEIYDRNQLNYQIGKVAAQYNVEIEKGITCLKIYIANHSVNDGVPKDWAYYRLAQIYKHKGAKRVALQWIDLALSTRPDFEQALDEKEQIQSL